MRVAIGSDHGGFVLKQMVADSLKKAGHRVLDVGAYDAEPSDYPDFAKAIAEAVLRGEAERGILICGSGVGASVASNKLPGIRASVCHDTFSAHQGVEDDDMNVLCLGQRVVGPELAKEIVFCFLSAQFSGSERHERRLHKMSEIEREYRRR
jgi:ribose 5-phosphate isomerase B